MIVCWFFLSLSQRNKSNLCCNTNFNKPCMGFKLRTWFKLRTREYHEIGNLLFQFHDNLLLMVHNMYLVFIRIITFFLFCSLERKLLTEQSLWMLATWRHWRIFLMTASSLAMWTWCRWMIVIFTTATHSHGTSLLPWISLASGNAWNSSGQVLHNICW